MTHSPVEQQANRRTRSIVTALALGGVALVFFLAVLFSRQMGGLSMVMTTGGIVLMVMLVVLIGANLRR